MKFIVFFLFLSIIFYSKAYKRTICDTVKLDGKHFLMKNDILSSFMVSHDKKIPQPDIIFINDDRSFTATYEVKEKKIFLTGLYILRKSQNDSLNYKYENIFKEVFEGVLEVEIKGLNSELIIVNQIDKYINYQLNFDNRVIYHLIVRKGIIQKQHRISLTKYKLLRFITYRKFKSTKKYEELRKYYYTCDDELFKRIIMDDIFHYAVSYE